MKSSEHTSQKGAPPTAASSVSLLLSSVAFLSGATCLIYELIWSRYLHLIFGVSAYAIATVLSCFMLGLATGSWHVGKRIDRSSNAVQLLLRLQLGIAGYILVSPLIYHALAMLAIWIFRAIPQIAMLQHAVRFVLAMLALIVPTYLMGGVFPALLQLASRRDGRVGSNVGWIYAINTLGGAVGAILSGFVLIRYLGLAGSLISASVASIAAAALLIRVSRFPAAENESSQRDTGVSPVPGASRTGETPVSRSTTPSERKRFLPLLVFAISGFTSLAYEVYWTRVLSFFFRDSIYDLTIVLTTFLCGIVIGSAIAARLLRRFNDAAQQLAIVEVLIGITALIGLFLIDQFPYWINHLQTNTAMVDRFGQQFWLAGNLIRFGYSFALMLAPTILFGMTFPLIASVCAGDGSHIGRHMGFATAMNTIGSALGALLAGFVFISLLGLQNGIVATAMLNILAGLLMAMAIRRGAIPLTALIALAVLLAGVLPKWDRLRMSSSFLDPNQNQPIEQILALEFYREDAHGLTSVVDLKPLSRKYLVTNRLFGQNNSDMLGLTDHRRLGLIPALLHPKPASALAVGLGAGVTLRGIAADPRVQRIDCVELSPSVIDAARYFAIENSRINDNPKVHFIANDGRNHISSTASTYDLIVLDIFHPMSSGSSTVFSREYFQLCRSRLNTGGIVCQWLPVHQLSMDEIRTIVATFKSVFPHTTLWFGLIGDSIATVGCIGSDLSQSIDIASLSENLKQPALATDLRDTALSIPELLISNFIMSDDAVDRFCGNAPIDTDNRPIVEFAAPKLATQSGRQGMLNLIEFSAQVRDISPLLRSADAEFLLRLEKCIAAKRAIIDGFKFALNDKRDAQLRSYQAALSKDPSNEDLSFAVRELSE